MLFLRAQRLEILEPRSVCLLAASPSRETATEKAKTNSTLPATTITNPNITRNHPFKITSLILSFNQLIIHYPSTPTAKSRPSTKAPSRLPLVTTRVKAGILLRGNLVICCEFTLFLGCDCLVFWVLVFLGVALSDVVLLIWLGWRLLIR